MINSQLNDQETNRPRTIAAPSDDPLKLDLTKVDRERALAAWLVYHGIERKDLARELGITPGAVTRIIQGKHRPKRRIDRLVEMGIPPELLPTP